MKRLILYNAVGPIAGESFFEIIKKCKKYLKAGICDIGKSI